MLTEEAYRRACYSGPILKPSPRTRIAQPPTQLEMASRFLTRLTTGLKGSSGSGDRSPRDSAQAKERKYSSTRSRRLRKRSSVSPEALEKAREQIADHYDGREPDDGRRSASFDMVEDHPPEEHTTHGGGSYRFVSH